LLEPSVEPLVELPAAAELPAAELPDPTPVAWTCSCIKVKELEQRVLSLEQEVLRLRAMCDGGESHVSRIDFLEHINAEEIDKLLKRVRDLENMRIV
jgi:hypothetical protein